ncbi:MAG: hypothetical protein KAW12_18395 [Candidatus Aminicenantes bacterium]|nr:hypothetical protein [Candidatus Aminicenantes bacterium]
MIRNPFFFWAADVRSGSMADDRVFVDLFGISALELLKKKLQNLWDMPIILLSAPGGGKSSLMRIFSAGALRYIEETAGQGGNREILAGRMEELGAFKDGKPYALGIWFRISDEYHSLQDIDGNGKNGFFNALLNSRIILNTIKAVCEVKGLNLTDDNDLSRISFSLKPGADTITISSWKKWGGDKGSEVFDKMAKLEFELCDMIDDPFWEGDRSNLAQGRLWSIDLLANLNILVDNNPFMFRPLVLLDDVHRLTGNQLKYLLNILFSRQVAMPFWISMRKQALGLQEILTERINHGIEKKRDYHIIDFEKDKSDFKKRALEIAKLRVRSTVPWSGNFPKDFNFLSDERENIFLENLNLQVVEKIKSKIEKAAGKRFPKFEKLIEKVEKYDLTIRELSLHLRKLEILAQRVVPQKNLPYPITSNDDLPKQDNGKAVMEAADLFLAKDYNLPYYFGNRRLIALSSYNIHQFLKLGGSLFEEIIIMNRLGKADELYLSPVRQHEIIKKAAKGFLNEIPTTMPFGSRIFRFIDAIGKMCKDETYRPTAPYAPGVTGIAITMSDYELLKNSAGKGDEKARILYQVIESAVAHNVLEPKANCKEKGKVFLVLYLNRLLCVPFQLPLQKGGFKEKKLSTLLKWVEPGYTKGKDREGNDLWQ